MKTGKTSNGHTMIVDDADAHFLHEHCWYGNVRGGYTTYATAHRPLGPEKIRQTLYLHRLIMAPPKGKAVDHINGDGLDNRRVNLRVCTHGENHINSSVQKRCASGYKGVEILLNGVFRAYVSVKRVKHYLGTFLTAEDAARARDAAAVKYHGEFARLNFPQKQQI